MPAIREKRIRVGSSLKVRSPEHTHRLPEGLPENSTVRILAAGYGMATVEYEGKEFRISDRCVQMGIEFFIDGHWLDENDPRVTPRYKRSQRPS